MEWLPSGQCAGRIEGKVIIVRCLGSIGGLAQGKRGSDDQEKPTNLTCLGCRNYWRFSTKRGAKSMRQYIRRVSVSNAGIQTYTIPEDGAVSAAEDGAALAAGDGVCGVVSVSSLLSAFTVNCVHTHQPRNCTCTGVFLSHCWHVAC